MTELTGTFTIDAWDQTDDPPAAGTTRGVAHVTKTFSGGLTGTSSTVIVLVGTESGAASYAGFEQFSGTADGREGTFVLRHAAEAGAGGRWLTWTVLPGSGTGDLAGVSGEGQIVRHDDGSHTYRLELARG